MFVVTKHIFVVTKLAMTKTFDETNMYFCHAKSMLVNKTFVATNTFTVVGTNICHDKNILSQQT